MGSRCKVHADPTGTLASDESAECFYCSSYLIMSPISSSAAVNDTNQSSLSDMYNLLPVNSLKMKLIG